MQKKLIYSSFKNPFGMYSIILDRDGVLNLDTGYPYIFEKMDFNIPLLEMISKKRDVILSLFIPTTTFVPNDLQYFSKLR